MIELSGDAWAYHRKGYWIAVLTNTTLDGRGNLVMGGGIAREAAERFPTLPRKLGIHIKSWGPTAGVCMLHEEGVINFPTKHDVSKPSTIEIVKKSMEELVWCCQKTALFQLREKIVMPRPGCGLGGLNWKDVKPILEPYFKEIGEDKIAVIHNG